MIRLIVGGSGSGKSEYAESRVMKIENPNRIYLATMQVFGEEGLERVARHRKLREGKGFVTLEMTHANSLEFFGNHPVVLLEDLPNLLANEFFSPAMEETAGADCCGKISRTAAAERILGWIGALAEKCDQLIIVSGDIFGEGTVFSRETEDYLGQLAWLHCELTKICEEVTAVTAGFPERVK